ncbi:MAG: hypothetical protein ACQETI_07755 [Halobacteriota archaeon]
MRHYKRRSRVAEWAALVGAEIPDPTAEEADQSLSTDADDTAD